MTEMDWANNTIEVLYFLVPGFIAAAVYYGLTSGAKPNTFGRVIQALIFAIIVKALSTFASLAGWVEEETWEAVAPSGEVVLAVIMGFALAVLANKDAQVDPRRSTNPLPTPDPSRRPPPPPAPPPPTR